MKKVFALAVAALMLLTLVACGQQTAESFTDQLNKEHTLVIATSPDYPPYEYYADDGTLAGFDIKAAEAIADILSKEYDIQIEWVAMDFKNIVSAVQLGQVDDGVACFTYDPERDVLFSLPYLKSAQVVVIPAGSDITKPDDLNGKTVGANLGSTGESAAQEKGANVVEMGGYNQMFEIMRNNGLDAIVCDEVVAEQYAASGDFTVLSEKLLDEEVSMIVSKEHSLLCDKLNGAIAEFMASDTYTQLKAEYGLD